MRKFKMTNAKGNVFDLSSSTAFLIFPAGLGTEREVIYRSIGNSYKELKTSTVRAIPNGTISFKGYSEFKEFADFLRYPPFVLNYQPEDVWYMKGCTLAILAKGEISQDTGRLDCDLQLNATTFWYTEQMVYRAGEVAPGAGKVYEFEYPYTYSDNSLGSVLLENDTNIEQPCKIIINGPAVNPGWVLIRNGRTIASGKVNVTVGEGERLIVNSDPLQYEIALYTKTNEFIKSVYGSSDFSTKRFIKIPLGNSSMSFSTDGATTITAYVEVKEEMELV